VPLTPPGAIDRSRRTGALGRRRLHRPGRLAGDTELRDWVAGRLKARWSPEQISRRLRREFPDQPRRWLCAETIYQAVYRPDLGGLPRELPGRVLRHRRRHRVPRRQAQARRSGPVTGMTPLESLASALTSPGGLEVGRYAARVLPGPAPWDHRGTRCGALRHRNKERARAADNWDAQLGPLVPTYWGAG
jgi:hypothetical protein